MFTCSSHGTCEAKAVELAAEGGLPTTDNKAGAEPTTTVELDK